MSSPQTPAIDALDRLGLRFEVTQHGPVSSLEEAAIARGVEPADLIKTLVVRKAANEHLLVLVPGDRVIAWPRLRELLGVSRLSMPDAQEARDVTGYERGTITPFGTKNSLPVVADERIRGRSVSIGGGAHGVAILIAGDDLITSTGATIADVTEPH